jgi:beta-lactamase class A
LKRQRSNSILRWISLIVIFLAVLLTGVELVVYSRIRTTFPPGLIIAEVPVGGLNQAETAQRLTQAYGVPVELRYNEGIVQIKPSVVGFELDIESMLAAADLQRINQPFWGAFWDFLWNRLPTPTPIPLRATLSEQRLREYLKEEVAPRFDEPPAAALPVPGSANFNPGKQGTVLDIDRAVTIINDALRSPAKRVVNLSYSRVDPPRPSLENLKILLQQVMDVAGFDGLAEIYMMDLSTGRELHFAYQEGKNIPPDIAFTAASTMKIPIMTSVLRRVPDPIPQPVVDALSLMIERSENDPADRLMQQVMDPNLGPLQVTEDMRSLGLQNTLLAGYFYPGAPLLQRIQTPANQREDVSTQPDDYNQTTPAEMGMLLEDVYQCSEMGGGTLAAVFPGQLSQDKCRQMINYLTLNQIGVLIQAGLPDGTRIAHKHGWILDWDGVIHNISDAAIVYSPGGNYILTIYLYHPVQLVFDPINKMVADLSRAVYNYFNMVKP